MAEKLYYYVTGNTAEGFVNFLDLNLQGIDHIIVINHSSNRVKTLVVQKLIEQFEQDEHQIEVICNALSRSFLDGIIVREKQLAIITDTIAQPELKATMTVLLNHLFEESDIQLEQQQINRLKKQYDHSLQQSYDCFQTGLKIHDDLEAIYINEMDFKKADHIADQFIEGLLQNVPKKDRQVTVYERLFGTSTAEGPITVVPQLINPLQKRVFVKGRAGTGKSVFMKKVAKACIDHGLDLEIHHCSFDPDSVDMVLVPELSFCMFDSTDPHEYFPERSDDELIDLYDLTVTPGTDERFADEIKTVHDQYKSYMKQGVVYIQQAASLHEKIDKLFEEHENPQQIDRAVKYILAQVH